MDAVRFERLKAQIAVITPPQLHHVVGHDPPIAEGPMEAGRFEHLKARVARELTPEQCVELGEVVQAAAASRLADVALAQAGEVGGLCPHGGRRI